MLKQLSLWLLPDFCIWTGVSCLSRCREARGQEFVELRLTKRHSCPNVALKCYLSVSWASTMLMHGWFSGNASTSQTISFPDQQFLRFHGLADAAKQTR